MKYHELTLTKHRRSHRVGRGISAGQGKTAGRGTKGQKSRTGHSKRPGFIGGQTPLVQQLPKLAGFRAVRSKADNVSVGQLAQLKGTTVSNASLAEAGLIRSPYTRVKLIGNATVSRKYTVQLQGISAGALASVQKAGGSFKSVPRAGRPQTSAKTGRRPATAPAAAGTNSAAESK